MPPKAFRLQALEFMGEIAGGTAKHSPKLFDGLLNRGASFLKVAGNHCWSDLNAGIEGQEPGFRDGWYLRGIAHVDNEDSSSLAIFSNEIGRLWFLLLKDFGNDAETFLGCFV